MSDVLKRIMTYREGKLVLAVRGEKGGAHFHYTYTKREKERVFGPCCGIELHHKKPVYEGQTPMANKCWLTKCDCYPDGSTLIAQEVFMPCFNDCNLTGDFEPLWKMVEEAYLDRVAGCQDQVTT